METLDVLYNNPGYGDNVVIVRCLNTILESKKPVLAQLNLFHRFLQHLSETSSVQRPEISDMLNTIDGLKQNLTFDNFLNILRSVYKQDMSNYKYIWILSYLRGVYETYFINSITYSSPGFALQHATGVEPWFVFLQAVEHNSFIYAQLD
jgi:hypothetical protein